MPRRNTGRSIEHLFRVREVQRKNARVHGVHLLAAAAGELRARAPAQDRPVTYLRRRRSARIVLEDVNIQASWVTMGMKVGQVALRFGANDFGR